MGKKPRWWLAETFAGSVGSSDGCLLYLHLQLIITLTLLHTFLDCPKTIKSNVGGADICHTFLVSND